MVVCRKITWLSAVAAGVVVFGAALFVSTVCAVDAPLDLCLHLKPGLLYGGTACTTSIADDRLAKLLQLCVRGRKCSSTIVTPSSSITPSSSMKSGCCWLSCFQRGAAHASCFVMSRGYAL